MKRRPSRHPSLRAVGAATALAALLAAGLAAGAAPAATAGPVPGAADPAAAAAREATVAGALDALRRNAAALGFATDGLGAAGLGELHDVLVADVMAEADGSSHVRLERTFAGLPVLGGDFVVHRAADGSWAGASATLRSPLGLDVVPAVSSAAAAAAAAVTATVPYAALASVVGEPRLVIETHSGAPALAWDVFTTGVQPDGTPSNLHTYVDALTGDVRFRDERIHTADDGGDDGRGASLYLGEVPLGTTLVGESFQLRDIARGGGYTADAEDRTDDCVAVLLPLCTSMAPATVFTDADDAWGDGSAAGRQTAAVDAHYGSAATWDYFLRSHGRAGVAGDGRGVYSRVHYGNNYANAFWNSDCQCMTYGDGDGEVLGPLVSLDIAGHEITHGLTSNTANLVNAGESGGLNESTSDIFGSMIEFAAKNPEDRGDYMLGETPFLDSGSKDRPAAIRYMHKPSLDRTSPDCYSSAVRDLGVHNAAGVGNHFFYLLAEGSKAKKISGMTVRSPTCNGEKVTGIGSTDAAQIWYRALTRYFTSGTDYVAARVATIRAARDIFGEDSAETRAVAAAWDAVNVPAVPLDERLGGTGLR